MNKDEEEALQAYIDGKIPRAIQGHYEQVVNAYRVAWSAALKWKKTSEKKQA